METYNYLAAVTDDVRTWINDNRAAIADFDRDELEEYLRETLWIDDSVTGNASGSYTYNSWTAEENLCHNWELLAEACAEFGTDLGEAVKKGAEFCDVTIRCHLLPDAIAAALDEMDN